MNIEYESVKEGRTTLGIKVRHTKKESELID